MSEDFILYGKKRSLGTFSVVRSLPQAQCRHVGPFVFLDHMGPTKVDNTHFLDVNPHPHIGLSTVTYLIEGRGHHRDSLGSDQIIESGDLNWMTAGKGIVHSERTPEGEITSPPTNEINGVQIWVSLPKEDEDCEPSFIHYSKDVLPKKQFSEYMEGKVLIGDFEGTLSPVVTHSRMLFMELCATSKGQTKLQIFEEEAAVFAFKGSPIVNGIEVHEDDLIVLGNPAQTVIEHDEDTILFVIAGKKHPEERYIWWNFVSSDKEKIREAADRWEKQQFPSVPGDIGRTELPEIPRI